MSLGYYKVTFRLTCGEFDSWHVKAMGFVEAHDRSVSFAELDNASIDRLEHVQYLKPIKEVKHG